MTKEEFIKNIVDNLTIRKEKGSDSTFYDYEGHTVFEHDPKRVALWVSWTHVWRIFENEYSMEYTNIQQFIIRHVVEPLNLVDVTPARVMLLISNMLWKP